MTEQSRQWPLTQAELIAGSRLAAKNARILFASGEALAAKQTYGVANSLLIQSAEEIVKSGLRAAAGFGSEYALKHLREAFSKHRRKHRLGLIPHLPDISMSWLKVLNSREPGNLMTA